MDDKETLNNHDFVQNPSDGTWTFEDLEAESEYEVSKSLADFLKFQGKDNAALFVAIFVKMEDLSDLFGMLKRCRQWDGLVKEIPLIISAQYTI